MRAAARRPARPPNSAPRVVASAPPATAAPAAARAWPARPAARRQAQLDQQARPGAACRSGCSRCGTIQLICDSQPAARAPRPAAVPQGRGRACAARRNSSCSKPSAATRPSSSVARPCFSAWGSSAGACGTTTSSRRTPALAQLRGQRAPGPRGCEAARSASSRPLLRRARSKTIAAVIGAAAGRLRASARQRPRSRASPRPGRARPGACTRAEAAAAPAPRASSAAPSAPPPHRAPAAPVGAPRRAVGRRRRQRRRSAHRVARLSMRPRC